MTISITETAKNLPKRLVDEYSDVTKSLDINVTNSNVINITELGIFLEAIDNKIIVMTDPYKSGYECKNCKGTGKVESPISTPECPVMRDCDECHGAGALIIIPDSVKSVPTSGIILSVGASCKLRTPADIGKRVLVGPHVGSGIPVKGSLKFRSLREDEIICWLWGTEGADKDFIEEEPHQF